MSLKEDYAMKSEAQEKLISLVQKYKCLYDINSSEYSDRFCKKKAWYEISKQMGMSADRCGKQWKLVRDNYRKAFKNREEKYGSSKRRRPIKLERKLSFINNYLTIREKTTSSSLSDLESTNSRQTPRNSLDSSNNVNYDRLSPSSNTQSLSIPPSTSLPSNQTVSDVLQKFLEIKANEEKDPIDTFFAAMATNVKKLPHRLQLEIKQKVFNVVNDAEMWLLNQSDYDDSCEDAQPRVKESRSPSSEDVKWLKIN